ncbi:TAXI family TRAP transporter solute-binding subunit [Polynucleobacter sp. AP-Nino-20-G2]|uniref:TAXI family TRAP transporter solute-binding subunit n=1 Tax=Polynucleobacter sp. AP-Nino-20-G2 TaxID=2576917 RepID=UPI001BFDCE99|nr:TAXI family TRAP transporter solute-binding subunit [Polynucleobacter sp. AP-Nino-20-G2]QWE17201.1 ABC transporter substrate-binding protein [Polynucleobacter sp. AP-Nino-20-G2]
MGSIKQDIKETYLGLFETVQEKWNDFTQFLMEAWPLLTILLVGLIGVWWYADPPPPRHVVMATGQLGGSYHALGEKYAAFFEKKGITLELLATKGAQENIEHLADRKDPVQAAFVQAGAFDPHTVTGVQSLGTISYDPIWLFYRGPEVKENDFQEIQARSKYFLNSRMSVGAKGSGTHAQAMHILKANGFDEGAHFLYLSGSQSVRALQKGEIDAAFIVDAYEAPNVQTLLADPTLHLSAFPRAEAYARLFPFMQILNVPTGAFSLVRNFPSKDIKLMASTTNLLIDDRMHPALQFLFLEAAREINGKASFFSEHGQFPSFKNTGLPESPVALHYEKNGSPLLMAYLPFWLAELINRLIFVLLPFCAVAYPVLLTLPGYRNKRIRRKINKLYGVLKGYEQELTDDFQPATKDQYLQKLDLLEYEALKLQVPKSMAGDYYSLRTSIDYVRNCLNRGTRPYQVIGEETLL